MNLARASKDLATGPIYLPLTLIDGPATLDGETVWRFQHADGRALAVRADVGLVALTAPTQGALDAVLAVEAGGAGYGIAAHRRGRTVEDLLDLLREAAAPPDLLRCP